MARVRPWLAGALLAVVTAFAQRTESAEPRALPTVQQAVAYLSDVRLPHWDRYIHAQIALDAAPDSVREWNARLLARDPDDVVAHWMRAAFTLSLRDTLAQRHLIAEADRAPNEPGAWVVAGTVLHSLARSARGREAFARAAELYRAKGRFSDASFARLFAVVKDRGATTARADSAEVAAAIALADAAHDRVAVATARMLASVRISEQSPELAIDALRSALTGDLPACGALAEGHRRLGGYFRVLGQLDSAQVRYTEAVQVTKRTGLETLLPTALQGLANVHKLRGEWRVCDELLADALERARALGSRPAMASLLTDRGNVQMSLRRIPEARATLLEALRIAQERGSDAELRIGVLDQLGGAEALLGRSDVARAYFDEALSLVRARGLWHREAVVLLHLTTLEQDQGQYERALELNTRTLASIRASGRRRFEGLALAGRAELLQALGQLDSARALAHRATQLIRETEPRGLPSATATEADVLTSLGAANEALHAIDDALATPWVAADSVATAYLFKWRGKVLAELGRFDEAARHFQRALRTYESLGIRDEAADARLSMGLVVLEQGDAAGAIPSFDVARRWYEAILEGSGSSSERASAQERWQELYAGLATARARSGDVAGAFGVLQASKARELRGLVGAHGVARVPDVPPKLAAEWREARESLTELQTRLVAEWSQPLGSRSRTLHRLEARADSMRGAMEELIRRVERASPTWAAQSGYAAPLGWQELAASLGRGRRMLAFLTGERRTLRFDVDSAGIRVREIGVGRREWQVRAERWRRAIERGDAAWQSDAEWFADSLLSGALDGRPNALVIIPHGPVHALPFEAMQVRAGGARQLIIERAEVIYASAPALMGRETGSLPRTPGALAAFGDPASPERASAARRSAVALTRLPHARREVEGLKQLWPDARLYVGAAATETRLLTEIERASVLHVASHGWVDHRHPEFSALWLARDTTDASSDGLVQAHEVGERRGGLELVTLSACESGRGRILLGEGLLGLTRAFTIAGARRIVASLWRVDDAATADFMMAFYARLKRGEPAARALRETKLAFLRDAQPGAGTGSVRGVARRQIHSLRQHPSVWAAFVLHENGVR